MGILFIVLVAGVILIGVPYFISATAFKAFEKNNTKNARDLAGFIFVVTFLILLVLIILFVVSNVRLGR